MPGASPWSNPTEDAPYLNAENHITEASPEELASCSLAFHKVAPFKPQVNDEKQRKAIRVRYYIHNLWFQRCDFVQNCFTALGDTMLKRFEREGTKWILQSCPCGHALSSRPSSRKETFGHFWAPWALGAPEILRWIHVPRVSGYEPMNQTLLFFAAARPVGQDAQARYKSAFWG